MSADLWSSTFLALAPKEKKEQKLLDRYLSPYIQESIDKLEDKVYGELNAPAMIGYIGWAFVASPSPCLSYPHGMEMGQIKISKATVQIKQMSFY